MNTAAEHPIDWFDPPDPRRNLFILRTGIWAIASLVGLLETIAMRFWLSPDATNYLDIAGGYLRLGIHQAPNAYWSPFFSWLLAAGLAITRSSPENESTLLHAVNFVGLLIALLAFEYFFRTLLRTRDEFQAASPQHRPPDFAFWALGYSVFLSSSFFILYLPSSTPDVWVCAFTYLAGGLLLSIHLRGASWTHFIALGFTLALAYLTKTFYFPLSFVFLLASWASAGLSRKSLKFAAAGLLTFSLVAGSWVVGLSRSEGRFTFGDVGKIAFAMSHARILQPVFWQGENSSGSPLHPVRQLASQPRVFEFSYPEKGTYPPGLYWSYWVRGLRTRFNASVFLSILRQSVGTFFLLFISHAEFVAALLFLFFAGSASQFLPTFRALSWLWLPPLVACASYALVLVEGRYVAPFLAILWIVAFFALSAGSGLSRKSFLALALAVFSVTGLRLAKLAQSDVLAIAAHPRNLDAEVALALRGLGLHDGDRIASLGSSGDLHWARQAGLTFVAEIPKGDEVFFWTAAPQKKQEIFGLLAGSGAKMIIAPDPAPSAPQEGWIRLGQTAFFAHSLLVPAR
jgi:hypothetical protein